MIFADIPPATAVFLDANVFVYHFEPHGQYGAACTELIERIEQQDLAGWTSAHVLAEAAHRLMALEAMKVFGWPQAGIAVRLRNHPREVQTLRQFRNALREIPNYGVQLVDLPAGLIDHAAAISQQTGLLTNDALIVALMQAHHLTALSSADSDFDRVPGISRYAPV